MTFNSIGSLDLTYFDNGNIATKSDVASGSTYGYGVKKSQCSVTPGDHALTGIGSSISYCYDARGNQTATYQNGSKTREVGYTGYDKPASIWSANALTEFNYDAGHKRFKRRDGGDGGNRTTYYIGGHEVVKHDSGLAEFKRYIGDMVIDIVRSNGTQDTHYLYRDHLGSLVAIADDQGAFIERLSYDAFGKRREGISWNALQSAFTLPSIKAALAITERGFTGHEHIDHANIIHMGGRIYDPGVGRFVQADPLVQAPQNGQSLNRYSYVFNNPLSYTDPTGYKTTCNIRDIRGGNEVCMNQGNGRDERYSKSGDKGRGSARQQAKASKAVQSASKGVSNGAFKNNGGGGDKTRKSAGDQTLRAPARYDATVKGSEFDDLPGQVNPGKKPLDIQEMIFGQFEVAMGGTGMFGAAIAAGACLILEPCGALAIFTIASVGTAAVLATNDGMNKIRSARDGVKRPNTIPALGKIVAGSKGEQVGTYIHNAVSVVGGVKSLATIAKGMENKAPEIFAMMGVAKSVHSEASKDN